MRIQTIEMSLPAELAAAEKRPADRPKAAAPPEDDSYVEQLVEACIAAIAKRNRFAFTAQRRTANAEQFHRELKSIVKGWTSTRTSPIADRDERAAVRAVLYRELLAIALHLTDASDGHRRSQRVLLGRVAAALSVLLIGATAVATWLVMSWTGPG